MLVTVRNNDNTETAYAFEPAVGRLAHLMDYYKKAYTSLEIQGFKIEDGTGKVLSFAGSF